MSNFLKSFLTGKPVENESNNRKNSKKNFEIFKYDGLTAQRMGRTDYAVKCFLEALAIENDFETAGHLSRLYMQTGEPTKACDVLKRMIEWQPQTVNTYLALAEAASMNEDYGMMEEACLKAIELDKDRAAARYFLAKACQGLRNMPDALTHLTQAIALKEDFMEARLMRADLLMQMNEYKGAASDLDFILKHNADEENALLLRGMLNEQAGSGQGAEEDYRKVISLNPFNAQACLRLGQCLIGQGRAGEAVEHLDETIELIPDCIAAYRERARAKRLMGDEQGAAEDMKRCLELTPGETNTPNDTFDRQEEQFDNLLGFRH